MIKFEGQLLGSELKLKKGHEQFDYEDNVLYYYTEYDEYSIDGIPKSSAFRMKTEEELAEQQKQQRISELVTLIEKKKLRGYDYSVELSELELLDPIL